MVEFKTIEDISKLPIEELYAIMKTTIFMNRLITMVGIGAIVLMMFFPYVLLIIPGIYGVYILSKMSVVSNQILHAVDTNITKYKNK